MAYFAVRIVIEHTGAGASGIPPSLQSNFLSVLEKAQPKPVKLVWSDIHRTDRTVVLYQLDAPNQFEALVKAKHIFETTFSPHLHQFQATLGNLEAEEVDAPQP